MITAQGLLANYVATSVGIMVRRGRWLSDADLAERLASAGKLSTHQARFGRPAGAAPRFAECAERFGVALCRGLHAQDGLPECPRVRQVALAQRECRHLP